MSEYQEFTGKTVEEALRSAREAFGVGGLDDLDFEILTPGSRGVLGMGAEPARIIAAPRSALGGAAPRREAAAATPLPPPPAARELRRSRPRDRATTAAAAAIDRPRRRDRGRAADAATAAIRPQAAADTAPPQRAPGAAPTATAAPAASAGRRPSRPRPRPLRPRPRRRPRRDSALARRAEQDEVAPARAACHVEREEIQAAEASPEALAAGREILERAARATWATRRP